MKPQAFQQFEKLTSDKTLPVTKILELRREELRKLMIAVRDQNELVRLQGRAAEVDDIINALAT